MENKMTRFFKRISANPYISTILLGIGLFIVLLIVLRISLSIYTRHGQTFAIPDFRGESVDRLPALVRKAGLRMEVTDSVYIFNRTPGSIVDQNPKPGTQVKKNRRVFVTINAKSPIKVDIPDVKGYTLRQAKAILEQQGFEVGKLSFTPDMGVNNVLEQFYKGKPAIPGMLIPKGSKIDLLLGMGMHGERTGLPLLIGVKFEEARNRIIEASLNVGRIKFDETIETYRDSLEARVYSQYPAYSEGTSLNFGTRVDIWLTLNESRIPIIKSFQADSIPVNGNYSGDEVIE